MLRTGLVALFAVALSLSPQPTHATVGFAEWEVQTPGGNFVTHSDPYIAECGICLMSEIHSQAGGVERKTYASRVSWWQYYPNYVTGEAAEGYFLFQEKTKSITFFRTLRELQQAIIQHHLPSPPTSKPMTPQDGWNETWGKILAPQKPK